jgi:hypothetical protein
LGKNSEDEDDDDDDEEDDDEKEIDMNGNDQTTEKSGKLTLGDMCLTAEQQVYLDTKTPEKKQRVLHEQSNDEQYQDCGEKVDSIDCENKERKERIESL